RVVTEVAQGNNTDTFEGKGDHHGLFTTDVIRDPAEQRTGNTVHDAVQHQCQRQSSHREEVHVDFEFLHAQVLSDNAQLSNCHHAAGYHADEHEEHQPEQLGVQCFFQRVVTDGLSQFCGSRNLTRFRTAQEHGGNESHTALQQTEEQEGFLEAGGFDHCCDGQNGRSGTSTVTTRGQAN